VDQEPNRAFGNTWDGLRVDIQESWMFRRPWKHSAGFTDELFVHVPYDTVRQLRRRNPDIVFSYELGFRSLASSIYCDLYRKPLVLCVCVSEHSERGRGVLRHWLRKYLLKRAYAVTYNGPSCRKYLQEQYSTPEAKLFHFPYCTSDLFRYNGPLERSPESDHRFLCIGQLSERKGVLPMLRSLCNYCESRPAQRLEIDLIGQGPLEEAIRSLQKPSNLEVRVLGHMNYEDMSRAMSQCGVLIFPTMADEWGLVVNEAMAAGLPVLGSVYGQASTALIKPGKNGWLYLPDRPEDFTEKLDIVTATSHSQLNAMRSAAQATVAQITPQNVSEQAFEMFRWVLQQRSTSGKR
jgi:glycosyltransferase involved in cell wall biosynthesis